jgi:hypothetical protein
MKGLRRHQTLLELGVDASTLQRDYQKKFEIPFNSGNKWMLERKSLWSLVILSSLL